MSRTELIQKWLTEGLTYEAIGKKLDISKQRVYQIANPGKVRRKQIKPECPL